MQAENAELVKEQGTSITVFSELLKRQRCELRSMLNSAFDNIAGLQKALRSEKAEKQALKMCTTLVRSNSLRMFRVVKVGPRP